MSIDWTTVIVAIVSTAGIVTGGFFTFRSQMRKEMREDRELESSLRLERESSVREHHARTDTVLWERMTSEFSRLQEQLTTVQCELAAERAARRDLGDRVLHLEKENAQLAKRVKQLEHENRVLSNENSALERQIDTLSKVD